MPPTLKTTASRTPPWAQPAVDHQDVGRLVPLLHDVDLVTGGEAGLLHIAVDGGLELEGHVFFDGGHGCTPNPSDKAQIRGEIKPLALTH